jgi:hypothetical protein
VKLKIVIPSNLDENNVTSFYQDTMGKIKIHEPNEVSFDFNNINFIKPPGVVTLWNMIDYMDEALGIDIFYLTPKDYVDRPRFYQAVDYLDDCLFFEKVMGRKLHPGSRERNTTNGLEKLQTGTFNQGYIDKTIAWLKGNLKLRKKSFSVLETALGEVFNNILDHSGSAIGGCAFAQHYPYYNIIQLCISDFGTGIPNKIRTKFSHDLIGKPLKLDSHAIRFATLPKISTKSTPRNRGAGLDNLVHIIENNKGFMKIISNEGSFVYNNYNNVQEVSLDDLGGYYQGTLVILKFKTNTLDIESEEDLSWL